MVQFAAVALLYRDPSAPPAPAEYWVAPVLARDHLVIAGDDQAWAPAGAIEWGPAQYATRFRALWSASALFLRFDCRDDAPWFTMSTRDDHLWEEEVVEIFLDVAARGADYAEIEISPANVVCDLRVHHPWPSLRADIAWNFDGLVTNVTAHADGWTATASLPWTGFASLAPAAAERVPPAAGDRWRFNVFRIKRPGGPAAPERDAVYAAWAVPDGPSFHVPAAFRDLRFS